VTDLFQDFLLLEPEIIDPETEKLAFLDRGYLTSPWAQEIDRFVARLGRIHTNNYLPLGEIPQLDLESLSFLHRDITEACICSIDGDKNCHWFGRRPLEPVQMWSATKFLTVYYLLTIVDSPVNPTSWQITDGNNRSFSFPFLVDLMFTYASTEISSNSLALLFKSFYSPAAIEGWLHTLTGDQRSVFQGGYGEPSFLLQPVLQVNDQSLLQGIYLHQGQNLVSAYALTRALVQLAWLDVFKRPEKYDVLIQAMAKDSARYLDVALQKRSLCHLSDVVILSKMGFGRSTERNRSELVYTALLTSTDRSCALTFKACLNLDDPAQEARHLDARLATEVTKTIGELGW